MSTLPGSWEVQNFWARGPPHRLGLPLISSVEDFLPLQPALLTVSYLTLLEGDREEVLFDAKVR